MAKLFNRVSVNTAVTGTGTTTLGSASALWLTADAGVQNGDVVSYILTGPTTWCRHQ